MPSFVFLPVFWPPAEPPKPPKLSACVSGGGCHPSAGISRVTHQGFLCQCFMLASGLGACVLTTEDYPARVAVSLAQQLTEQFDLEVGAATWRSAVDFSHNSWAPIGSAIVKFQNPVEADTLLRVRSKLDKTKESLVQTIDDVLKRGEALEKLTEESKDLSETSRKFYTTAAKTDSCCAVM